MFVRRPYRSMLAKAQESELNGKEASDEAFVKRLHDGVQICQGDLAGARYASEQAKKWCWIAGIMGFVGVVAYIGFMVIVGLNA